MNLSIDPAHIKGFLSPREGEALYRYAAEAADCGPCLEIGSYCGKSTVYIGTACRDTGNVLFAVDHHRGSEEHQRGQMYHDSALYDEAADRMDSLSEFRRTLHRAELEANVIPIVAPSALAAKYLDTPLGFVFIDGGHSLESAMADYRGWSGKLVPGGILAIHDLFPDPADGGQAPWTIYQLARQSGLFEELAVIETLGVLRRLG